MKSNSWNNYLGITTFGESHGIAIGVVIQDIKPGIEFPLAKIQKTLNARKPGNKRFSSGRKEEDRIQILSGVLEGKTTGMPICMVVYNKDAKPEDYENLKKIFRPGHADFSLFKKFKIYDYRGGGRASGRETIARVAASGMVDHLLQDIIIKIYPVKIGKFEISNIDTSFQNELNWSDRNNYNELVEYLKKIKRSGDSIGGIVEVKIENIPAGLGDPVFEKLDANLAKAILSIGAVKGIEFGDGFILASLQGSQANDQMEKEGFLSNHSGGILGGISTGQNITFRFVVKPTSSINIEQKTISHSGEEIKFKSSGRHDTCIIPRIIPVARAMIKLVLSDVISYQKLIDNAQLEITDFREAIDKIDEDILIGLLRRQEISKLIGEYKKKHNLKSEDKKREKELLEKLKLKAKTWGLNEKQVSTLWKIILENSKKVQC